MILIVAACSSTGETAETTSTVETTTTTAPIPTTTAPPPPPTTTTAPETTTTGFSEEELGLIDMGQEVITTFASLDADQLEELLTEVAPKAVLTDLYYRQEHSEYLNYEIIGDVVCEPTGANVRCTFPSEDDLTRLLETQWVEIWTFFMVSGEILTIELTDEPDPTVGALFDWINETNPEFFEGPCDGFGSDNLAVECAMDIIDHAEAYLESGAGNSGG